MSRILVTGASGYVALHVVDQLLKAGHRVRGTVRSLTNAEKVAPLKMLGESAQHPLELVEADLLDASSWAKAVEDIDIVMHVASPVTINPSIPDDAIIRPALEGTLNVLNAAQRAGVKRVVLTSSGLAERAAWEFVDEMIFGVVLRVGRYSSKFHTRIAIPLVCFIWTRMLYLFLIILHRSFKL